jgi:hypothetical protein
LLQSDLIPEALKDQKEMIRSLRQGLEKVTNACKIRTLLESRVEEARTTLQLRVDSKQEGSIGADLESQKAKLESSRSALSRYRWFSIVVFLIGLCSIVLGVDHQYQWGISDYVPWLQGLSQDEGVGFLVAAGGAAFFVLACWLASQASVAKQKGFDADGAISRLAMEQEVGGSSLEAANAHLSRNFEGLDPGDEVGECRVSSVQNALDALRKSRRDLHREMGDKPGEYLARGLKKSQDRVRLTLKDCRKGLDEANDSVKRLRSKRDRIQSEIREYQNQDGRRRALDEFSDGLRKKSLAIREEMDIHRLLVELLDETIESVRMRAGPSLGKGLCRLLPHLTGGRYRDAQVTPDFEIRLFTGEKSDFLQPHELSGGTLQGLSFGFRLAFAQAFVRAVTGAPQFLFLDEPFPAMDRQRVLMTLQALPRLSQELSQVIVAHPDLDDAAKESFDILIETDVAVDHLEIDLLRPGFSEIPTPVAESSSTKPRASSKSGSSKAASSKPRESKNRGREDGGSAATDFSASKVKDRKDPESHSEAVEKKVVDPISSRPAAVVDSQKKAPMETPEATPADSTPADSTPAESTPADSTPAESPAMVEPDDWTIPEA